MWLKNLSVEGSVYAQRFAGGVAGRNQGLIENVYNHASITAYDYYAGGISGYNNGVIQVAYNTGNINAVRYDYVGGIVGATAKDTSVLSVYNSGYLSGRYYIGGIIGYASGELTNAYSYGLVSGAGYLGGIIGSVDGNSVVNSSYYDQSVMVKETKNQPERLVILLMAKLTMVYQLRC